MDQSAGAAKTKCHKLGSLQNRPFFLTVLEAGRSRSRCQAIQFLVRLLLLAWRQLPSFCMSTWPFLSTCVRTEIERESKPSAISSYKGTNSIMRGPLSWTYLTLNTSQTPHPQYYHIGIRASTYAFQENTNFQSTIPHKHQKLSMFNSNNRKTNTGLRRKRVTYMTVTIHMGK